MLSIQDGDVSKVTSCEHLSEVLFVFRASYGYSAQPESYLKRVSYIFEDLLERSTLWFGKNTRLGIVTYQDKPAKYFGLPGNKCAQLIVPLTNLSQMDNYRNLSNHMKPIDIVNTGEDADGAIDGIIRGALYEKVGWSKEDHDPITQLPIRRIIILVTDAYPHLGQSLYLAQPRYIDVIREFNKTECVHDINGLCEEMDFPSRQDVNKILSERNISLFVVGWKEKRTPKIGGWPREEYGVPGEIFHYLAHQGYSVWQIGSYFSPRDDFVAIFYDDLFNQSTVHYKSILHNLDNFHDPPTGALIREQMLKWYYPNESCSKQSIRFPPIKQPYIEATPLNESVNVTEMHAVELKTQQEKLNPPESNTSRANQSLIAGGVAGVIALAGIGVMFGKGLSGSSPSFSCSDDAYDDPSETEAPPADCEARDQIASITQELFT